MEQFRGKTGVEEKQNNKTLLFNQIATSCLKSVQWRMDYLLEGGT